MITTLKAQMQVDPEVAKKRIRIVLRKWSGTTEPGGMVGNAAAELGVSRATLQRMIHSDSALLEYMQKHDLRYQRQGKK